MRYLLTKINQAVDLSESIATDLANVSEHLQKDNENKELQKNLKHIENKYDRLLNLLIESYMVASAMQQNNNS